MILIKVILLTDGRWFWIGEMVDIEMKCQDEIEEPNCLKSW